MTYINLKKAQEWLVRKSLPDFIREFWDSYETAPFVDCWLIDWQSECFMYSVKHFLPYYVWKDWITDEEYAKIKIETGGVCPVRDKMFAGQHVRNHDWNMPPRHSKTSIIGVCGPTWLSINTACSTATVSHNSNLSSETNSKRLKLLQSDKFAYYFHSDPKLRLAKQSATNIKLVGGSQMYAVCQVSFTGLGADCFPEGTKILTLFGYEDISKLVDNDKIISYNTKNSKFEISSIQATRRIIDDKFIRVTTTDGRTIESTPDHRYWVVGKGYVRASQLTKEDVLLTDSSLYNSLQDMWKNNKRCETSVSKMCLKNMELFNNAEMRQMWKNVSEKNIRLIRKLKERIDKRVLLSSLRFSGKQRETDKTYSVSDLWKIISYQWSEILFSAMSSNSLREQKSVKTTANKDMSNVWKDNSIRAEDKILFEELCRHSSFAKNGRNWKFSLHRWQKLSDTVSQSFGGHNNTRQLSLSDMRSAIRISTVYAKRLLSCKAKFNSTSYRPEQIQQFCREFGYFMYLLSYKTAQECRVSTITQFTDKKVVYDIQTSKNHNFFANGILVHNCIIADDLISADNAARDMQMLKNVRAFFKQTLPTRLNSKTTGVIWHVQQRLAPGDISGMIADSPELQSVYSHTELQAEAEKDIVLIYPCSGKVREIHKGDLLWPERFGDYTQLKLETGSTIFQTQYQQKAKSSDLTVVKEQHIHYIDEEDYESFKNVAECVYASHDCPVKDNEANDYHGFCGGYGMENQLVIDEGWEEHLGYIKEKTLMRTRQQLCPSLIQVVEEKANGAALLQDLRYEVPGMVPFNPGTNSKRQRLEIASNYISTGAVRFVKNDKTKYLIQKLIDFPFVDHDDIVDACSQLILYHFTQRKNGVYTKCFTYENIIKLESLNEKYDPRNDIYAVTINTDLIKVCRMNIRNDKYVVEQEWLMQGIEKFEEFYANNFITMPIMIDCSYENTLYKLIRNPNIVLTPFTDDKREESIHSLKVGFYKKKVLVNKDCAQTINDISKLRLTDTSVAKGQQVVNTYDEGLAGCVRCLVQYYHGLSSVW